MCAIPLLIQGKIIASYIALFSLCLPFIVFQYSFFFLCLGATQHLTTIAANILDSDMFQNENENTDTLQINFLQKVYVSFKLNPSFAILKT